MSNDISQALGGDFRPDDVPNATFEPLPPGWYAAQIDAASVKDTESKTGKYLKLELVILDQPYNGRRVFTNITLVNPSQVAVEIGQRQLANLAHACGITALRDSAELLQRFVQIRLKIKEEKGYDPQNEVTGYKPPNTTAPGPQPMQDKPAAPAKSAKRPWER